MQGAAQTQSHTGLSTCGGFDSRSKCSRPMPASGQHERHAAAQISSPQRPKDWAWRCGPRDSNGFGSMPRGCSLRARQASRSPNAAVRLRPINDALDLGRMPLPIQPPGAENRRHDRQPQHVANRETEHRAPPIGLRQLPDSTRQVLRIEIGPQPPLHWCDVPAAGTLTTFRDARQTC